jgi:glycosyltransferase involved in cell wall biosynthesis
VPLPENIGQVAALNKGLEMIDTPLVARMDADDISMPRRFERQVEFMATHPEIGICGTNAIAFEGERRTKWRKPKNPADVKARLLFGCCLVHPSVMMRQTLLNFHHLRYNEEIGFSEDWELWIRASALFKLANIPEFLIRYRIHPQSVSKKNLEFQKKVDEKLIMQLLEPLGLSQHPLQAIHKEIAQVTTFNAIGRGRDFLIHVRKWVKELNKANQQAHIYREKSLLCETKRILFMILNLNPEHTALGFKLFFKEYLFLYLGLFTSLRFILKMLLFSLKGKTGVEGSES